MDWIHPPRWEIPGWLSARWKPGLGARLVAAQAMTGWKGPVQSGEMYRHDRPHECWCTAGRQ